MFVIHVIREDGGVLLGDQVIDLNREFLYIPPQNKFSSRTAGGKLRRTCNPGSLGSGC